MQRTECGCDYLQEGCEGGWLEKGLWKKKRSSLKIWSRDEGVCKKEEGM